jgi:hypothetical protein
MQRLRQAERRLVRRADWQYARTVFTNRSGGCLHNTTVTYYFQRILVRAGLLRIASNDLRHGVRIM